MPVLKIDDVLICVWSAGIQITKIDSTEKLFFSKDSIGTIMTVKNDNLCAVRYIPIHSQNYIPIDIVSWFKEKSPSNNANKAYEFIMEHLYSAPDGAISDSLYV